jgi:hypothetical protein
MTANGQLNGQTVGESRLADPTLYMADGYVVGA